MQSFLSVVFFRSSTEYICFVLGSEYFLITHLALQNSYVEQRV